MAEKVTLEGYPMLLAFIESMPEWHVSEDRMEACRGRSSRVVVIDAVDPPLLVHYFAGVRVVLQTRDENEMIAQLRATERRLSP
ncbi:MAG: hypothetical protein AAF585_04620 [Verrucomicrobiota bacterium]